MIVSMNHSSVFFSSARTFVKEYFLFFVGTSPSGLKDTHIQIARCSLDANCQREVEVVDSCKWLFRTKASYADLGGEHTTHIQ